MPRLTRAPRLLSPAPQSNLSTEKRVDPFYLSREWKELGQACLKRDGYWCTVCCARPATIPDHIVSRRTGGQDVLENLRSLCRVCDNALKENVRGERRSAP